MRIQKLHKMNQTEIQELKIQKLKFKNSTEEFTSRFHQAEKKIRKFKDQVVKII